MKAKRIINKAIFKKKGLLYFVLNKGVQTEADKIAEEKVRKGKKFASLRSKIKEKNS